MTVNADYSSAAPDRGVRYWSPSLRAMAGPQGKNNSINNHRKNLQIIISSHIQRSRAIHI